MLLYIDTLWNIVKIYLKFFSFTLFSCLLETMCALMVGFLLCGCQSNFVLSTNVTHLQDQETQFVRLAGSLKGIKNIR